MVKAKWPNVLALIVVLGIVGVTIYAGVSGDRGQTDMIFEDNIQVPNECIVEDSDGELVVEECTDVRG